MMKNLESRKQTNHYGNTQRKNGSRAGGIQSIFSGSHFLTVSTLLFVVATLLPKEVQAFIPNLAGASHPQKQRQVSHPPARIVSSSSLSLSAEDSSPQVTSSNNNVRFLGMGPNAIVRPGVVLIAPPDEFHHFYRQSAIFIYAMGEDETYNNTYVIRGTIIDHPTPFTLAEMMEEGDATKEEASGPLSQNLIYRGGDRGEDSLFLLHNQPTVGAGIEIGTSGIYEGGLQDAIAACQEGTGNVTPQDFKFHFNYCEFTEDQLEQMLADDPWISAEIPPEMILSAEWDRGDCWRQLRNSLRDQLQQDTL